MCKEFANYIKSLRFLDDFAMNLQKNVSDAGGKISGLKPHDCRVMLQRLLTPRIRPYLRKEVRWTIIELYNFVQLICALTLCVEDLMTA